MRRKWVEVGLAGAVAGLVVACGSRVADMTGGVLSDAGDVLSDAGVAVSDAGGETMGEWLHDAGGLMADAGQVLSDAGRSMRDASGDMAEDARAQDCGLCDAGGGSAAVVTQVTADQDPAQLRSGTVTPADWQRTVFSAETFAGGFMNYAAYHWIELAQGPFLLTDLWAHQGQVTLLIAPDCAAPAPDAELRPSIPEPEVPESRRLLSLVPSLSDRANGFYRPETRMHGGRLHVPAGAKLCALGASMTAQVESDLETPPTSFYWGGFEPY